MTNIQLAGELLTASEETRILSYKLLPYDSQGSTNLGKITASKGTITFPDDVTSLPVNEEHDYKKPVGRFASVEEREDGLYASVYVIDTQAGNDALKLAASGLRKGISVEIESPVIRAGVLTAGALSGAGLVVRPAFANALLVASDFGDIEETPSTPELDEEETEAEAEADAPTPTKESEMTETNATVPAELQAANAASTPALTPALIAKAYATKDTRLAASLTDAGLVGEENLFAALSPITSTAHTANVEQSQWLGELWSGKAYNRKYAAIVNTGSLTSWKVEGWKFVTKPVVGDYAGDLTDIPTNTVVTEHYSEEAERLAGGWKLDRKYRDFGNTEFISSFFRAAVEDYSRKSDRKVLDFIVANAQAVTGTTVPTGVAPAAAKIVHGAMDMIDVATPTFALVGKAAYEQMLMTTEFDNLKFITQSLGLEGGNTAGFQVIPSAEIGANDVYVGAKEAITFFELPGTPIQVTALDISKGGEDEALFGYVCLILNDNRALLKVS